MTDADIQRYEAVESQAGQGARVKRAFPTGTRGHFDPFVLLDEFYVEAPGGFPEHPHRGFEIITYMLEGAFEHADSTGASETIQAGGAQRLTAGSGLEHSELPGSEGLNRGLQLWINLPQEQKAVEPDYADASDEEFPVETRDGTTVKTVIGDDSPLSLHTPVEYEVVDLEPGAPYEWTVPAEWQAILYVTDGAVTLTDEELSEGSFATHLGELTTTVTAEAETTLVAIAGEPHGEEIRQRGPVVL